MSRPCAWCAHPERARLEERVLRGESVQSVSVDADLPHWPSAGHRHFRNHVGPEKRRVARAHVADFAERLLGLADDAADQRERGRARGDSRTVLAALRAEKEVIGELTGVLGISHEEVVEQLQEARHLILAVCDVIRDRPELAGLLACELDRRDQTDLADSLRGLVSEPEPRHLQALPDASPKEIQP